MYRFPLQYDFIVLYLILYILDPLSFFFVLLHLRKMILFGFSLVSGKFSEVLQVGMVMKLIARIIVLKQYICNRSLMTDQGKVQDGPFLPGIFPTIFPRDLSLAQRTAQ